MITPEHFKYIDKIIDNCEQISELKGITQAFSVDNVFKKEDYKKLSLDVIKYKHLTMKSAPPEGEEPSVITLERLEEIDSYYKSLWRYFNSNPIKEKLLKKFGYKNIEKILRCMHMTISFHTEYPHQIDNAHTDQKNTLATFTLQVYLPIDDSIKEYGTVFLDTKQNLYKKDFLPNSGYLMSSNNNSWHRPTMGVERKSLLVRYFIEMDYEKIRRSFNYNKNNKTCYIVWNKDMGVHKKITDWMTNVTLLNMVEHNFENIVCMSTSPYMNNLLQLTRLKMQGFKKAVIFFGGYVWKTNKIIQYANELDMKHKVIAGFLINNNTEFARQCVIINLDRLDEIQESDAHDNKFFARYVDDIIDIGDLVAENRVYYHPELIESGKVNGYIQDDKVVEQVCDKHPELAKQLEYINSYRTNYRSLCSITDSIDNKPVFPCPGSCRCETIHLDTVVDEKVTVSYCPINITNGEDKITANDKSAIASYSMIPELPGYICTKCSSTELGDSDARESLNPTDYDETLYKIYGDIRESV